MLKKTADLSKIILEVSECSEDGTRDKAQCHKGGIGFGKDDTNISVATIGTTNSTLAPETIRKNSCRECDLLSQE